MKFLSPITISIALKTKFVLSVLFVIIHVVAFAQKPTVAASLEKANIAIGDQILLKLNATFNPQTHRIQFPVLNDTFNHIEVLEKLKVDTTQKGNLLDVMQKVKVTSFDSGRWEIPALTFVVQPLNGDSSFASTSAPIILDVRSPKVDTSQPFKPIKTIEDAQMPLKEILTYAAIGLLLIIGIVALLIFLYKKWKKSRKKDIPKPKEPVLPPHEKALKALQALEAKQLWQGGDEKGYHTELSDILRAYLEDQFNIDCFEKTTSEIVYQVKRVRLLTSFRQDIRDVLTLSDLVKFAKAKPMPEEHVQTLETIRTVITESYKKVKLAEAKPETRSE